MSGKLAWSIGIALALIGVAMFAMTFVMRDPKAVKDATARVPSSIPSRTTNEELTKDRIKVAEELAARQTELRKHVGVNDNEIIYDKYRVIGGIDFARQTWPQEKAKLNDILNPIKVKAPRWNQNGVIDTRMAIETDPFSSFDELLGRDPLYTENNHRIGRLAATAIREFIVTAETEVNAVKSERIGGNAPVFEIVKFDLNADKARFSEPAESAVYGAEDPFIRRNMLVEFVADPVLADRIVRAFYNRNAKTSMMRVAHVSQTTFEVPTSTMEEITAERVRQLIATDRRYQTKFPELIALAGNAKELSKWLEAPENFTKLKVELDVDPSAVRPAIPTRVKLRLQFCELRPDAKLLAPLEKATEGLPAAQATQ